MTKIFDEISRLPEFEKDIKRLLKKFKTLEDDLKVFIEKELNLYHKLMYRNFNVEILHSALLRSE